MHRLQIYQHSIQGTTFYLSRTEREQQRIRSVTVLSAVDLNSFGVCLSPLLANRDHLHARSHTPQPFSILVHRLFSQCAVRWRDKNTLIFPFRFGFFFAAMGWTRIRGTNLFPAISECRCIVNQHNRIKLKKNPNQTNRIKTRANRLLMGFHSEDVQSADWMKEKIAEKKTEEKKRKKCRAKLFIRSVSMWRR